MNTSHKNESALKSFCKFCTIPWTKQAAGQSLCSHYREREQPAVWGWAESQERSARNRRGHRGDEPWLIKYRRLWKQQITEALPVTNSFPNLRSFSSMCCCGRGVGAGGAREWRSEAFAKQGNALYMRLGRADKTPFPSLWLYLLEQGNESCPYILHACWTVY